MRRQQKHTSSSNLSTCCVQCTKCHWHINKKYCTVQDEGTRTKYHEGLVVFSMNCSSRVCTICQRDASMDLSSTARLPGFWLHKNSMHAEWRIESWDVTCSICIYLTSSLVASTSGSVCWANSCVCVWVRRWVWGVCVCACHTPFKGVKTYTTTIPP